jgi:hypothetical protein
MEFTPVESTSADSEGDNVDKEIRSVVATSARNGLSIQPPKRAHFEYRLLHMPHADASDIE